MTPNLELLKAEIRGEIEKLETLAAEFHRVSGKLDLTPGDVPFYDRGAIGYLLHCFYNGCELDWDKERRIAAKLPETFALFKEQIGRFLDGIDSL